jgi:hypothetical protein
MGRMKMSNLTLGKMDTSLLMGRITTDLNKYPKRSDFDYSGDVSMSGFGIAKGKMDAGISRENYISNYEELLGSKVKDEKTRKKIIEYAELMVQKRSILSLDITTEESASPFSIQVIGTLPEHVNTCSNYWIGKSIDSQSLTKEISKFKSELEKYGISDAFDENYIGQTGKIVSIKRVLKNY